MRVTENEEIGKCKTGRMKVRQEAWVKKNERRESLG